MNNNTRWIIVCVIYFIGANLAYGWAASNPCPAPTGYYKEGTAPACGTAGDGYFAGVMAALTWPAYLTTQVMKHDRKPENVS